MQYMGSKNRIAKHLLSVMLPYRKPGQWWVEPFVGGGNMIDKVGGRRIGGDVNIYLIELLRAVRITT
jgi:DNA adenine methylase